jgi:hypothetical protein
MSKVFTKTSKQYLKTLDFCQVCVALFAGPSNNEPLEGSTSLNSITPSTRDPNAPALQDDIVN